jgi:hypothetical protein
MGRISATSYPSLKNLRKVASGLQHLAEGKAVDEFTCLTTAACNNASDSFLRLYAQRQAVLMLFQK